MVENGFVTMGKFGNAEMMLVSARDCFNEGYKFLQENPCVFIKEPYYVRE